MVSEQPNEANDNFFTHFSYEAWAPRELQKLYPKVVEIESVLERLEDEPTLEASFTLFWELVEITQTATHLIEPQNQIEITKTVLLEAGTKLPQHWPLIRQTIEEFYNKKREDVLNKLAGLVQRLQPNMMADEYLPDLEAIMFAHLSAAFAVFPEYLDKGPTERFWEVVQKGLAVLKRPKTEGLTPWYEKTKFSLTLTTSTQLVETMFWAKLFHKNYAEASYESA